MANRGYRRLANTHADDGDLHVDVMRFFAIVALCLFAILPHTEPMTQSLDTPSEVTPKHVTHSPDTHSPDTERDRARHHYSTPVIVPEAVIQTTTSAEIPPAQAQRDASVHTSTQASSTQPQQVLETENVVARIRAEHPSPESRHNSGDVLKRQLAVLDELGELEPSHASGSTSTSQQGGGVRFLNGDVFASAVANGSITLVYHDQGASFVFDTAQHGFTRVSDLSLQIFGLAASEIPESLRRAAPKGHRPLTGAEQWFITLPEQTLAYLINARSSERETTVLNEWASPI